MTLYNSLHERFAVLVASGNKATEAYRILRPEIKNHHIMASRIMKRPDVYKRIRELRSGIEEKVVMSIAEKRNYLRLMALGQMPTSIQKSDGTVHDMLSAIRADAMFAGELARKRL